MILDIFHSFVNIFAGGRSDIKSTLFVVYLISLGIGYYIFRHRQYRHPQWKWFGISLLVTYLYGLGLHIFYALMARVSPLDFLITGNNGEISSSTLWHTHIAKGGLGEFFALLGKPVFDTADTGGAYVHTVPSVLLFIGLGLVIILLVQVVIYFVTAFIPMIARKTTRQKVFLIFGYSVVSFSLVKTSIDGGIFNNSFVLALIFIGLFIIRQKHIRALPYYLLTSVGVALVGLSMLSTSLDSTINLLLANIAALFLLYTTILYGSESKPRWQLFISIFILLLCGWWLASSRDQAIYAYSTIEITKHQPFYYYNDAKKEVIRITSDSNESIGALSSRLHKNITYLPITAPGITCMEKAPFHSFSTQIISERKITPQMFSSLPSSYLYIKARPSLPQGGSRWITNLTISMHPCLPEPLSSLDGYLQEAGITSYLLVNPNLDDHADTE